MAMRASREMLFDASPEVILDALADMEDVPSWSSVHQRVEVLDRHPDGRPHHVKATLKLMGVTDREVLEYHWGPDWMVWDAEDTFQQRGQHGEFILTRLGDQTRVRFDLCIDVAAPIPEFLARRAKRIVLDAAIERLRSHVSRNNG
jgi:hypothetical protein